MATATATSGHASEKAPHQAANPGPQQLRERVEINDFASLHRYVYQRELFIQAFAAVQAKPVDDKMSYYQIAGIHGLPYQSYDGVEGQGAGKWPDTKYADRWGGYCQHGSPLFPTWHRPYVLLLETAIRTEAMKIAQSYSETDPADKDKGPKPTARDVYVKAAEELSLPYWDWASAQTADFGLPKIITSPTYKVRTPTSFPKKTDHPNPLRAFTLPEDLGSLKHSSDCFNPTAKPNYKVPFNNEPPFTPRGYWTTRHPDANYQTQVDQVNLTVQMYANVMFRPNLYALLDVNQWFPFSNHAAFKKDQETAYGWYTSVETMHDGVHDAVGGSGGHMTYPDIAGFDPIFFLHHANVDRIIALWQACHPDVWIEDELLIKTKRGTFSEAEGTVLNSKTELTPFRKGDSNSPCYTSDDVRHVADLGYTYPELQNYPDPTKLMTHLKKIYKPDTYEGLRWSLVLKSIPKRLFGGSFTIYVFLGLDHDPTPGHPDLTDIHFVGPISIFARGNNTRCANCRMNDDVRLRARLDITNTMIKLGLDTDQEPWEDFGRGDKIPNIQGKLKDAVSFMVIDKSGQQKDWKPDPSEYDIHKERKNTTDPVPLVPSSEEKRASGGDASGPAEKKVQK